jgi:type III secretion protein J
VKVERAMRPSLLPSALALLVAACSPSAGLLTGLDERAANEVLVALSEAGIPAEKVRGDGQDATFSVTVPAGEAARAHRVLAERELPRARPPGFEEVFANGSMVPTPLEEQARYGHALAGELARSIESLDGVLEARVHLGLARPDPLRPGDAPPARAAVLVKCRPSGCDALRALEGGLRALVAGAADGLDPAAVAVVIAPGAAPTPPPEPPPRRANGLLLGLAGLAATGAIGLAGAGLLGRLRSGGGA